MSEKKDMLAGMLSSVGIVGVIPSLSIAECEKMANSVIPVITETGLAQVERRIGRSIRKQEFVVINENTFSPSDSLNFDSCMSDSCYGGVWQYCKKYNQARYNKRKRALQRIKCMFVKSEKENIPLYFVTFTFSDETLKNRNTDSRRQAVRRCLTSGNFIDFYANIDFGEKNGREHYHAIVLGNGYFYKDGKTNKVYAGSNESFADYSSKFGNIKSELVKQCSKSDKQLSKYINKFSNHATKDTTNFRVHCITKRGVKYPEEYYKTAEKISIDHYHNYLKHKEEMKKVSKYWPDYKK